MCVHKSFARIKKEEDLNGADMPKEESVLFVKGVEAARELLKGQRKSSHPLWRMYLTVARTFYGQPKQKERSQSRISACTWATVCRVKVATCVAAGGEGGTKTTGEQAAGSCR